MASEIKFVTFTGPSGVGKTEIQHGFVSRTSNVRIMTSDTDRARRPSDRDGDYNYWPASQRLYHQEQGDVVWEVEFADHWYWARRSVLEEAARAEHLSTMILVPKVVPRLHEMFPGQVLSFWVIGPSTDELRRRLTARGDNPEKIERVLQESIDWLPGQEINWQFLRNDRPLSNTVDELLAITRLVYQLPIQLR